MITFNKNSAKKSPSHKNEHILRQQRSYTNARVSGERTIATTTNLSGQAMVQPGNARLTLEQYRKIGDNLNYLAEMENESIKRFVTAISEK